MSSPADRGDLRPSELLQQPPSASVAARPGESLGHGLMRPFRLLHRKRALIWAMTQRELFTPYAGQMLGGFWTIVHPLFLVGLLAVVFTALLGARFPGAEVRSNYTVYLLSGLVPWFTTSAVLSRSASEIVANAGLVKQVVFPLEVLPVKAVTSSLSTLLVGIAFITVYSGIRFGLPWSYLLVPILCLVHILWLIGIAMVLSALGAFFRDLKDVIRLYVTAGVYLSPIIYPGEIPAIVKPLIYINPFSYLIWVYQDVMFAGAFEHGGAAVVVVVFSVSTFYAGFALFRKMKTQFGNVL